MSKKISIWVAIEYYTTWIIIIALLVAVLLAMNGGAE